MIRLSGQFQLVPIGLLLFFALGVNDGHAALEDFSEESLIQDVPVVLSASRLRQPIHEAPNAMTVIDRAMIKASGFRKITDLFKLAPGMYATYWSGNRAIVSYHGTTDDTARRMQILVDDRTVYMPPMGGMPWEDLPLQMEDIERIEVVRGPAAASHGGNSTQGVINIITRDAGAMQGFKASLTKGNGGISDAAVNLGNRGESFDYRLSMGYRSDHGYDPSTYPLNSYNGSTHDPNNDSYGTHLINLRAAYHPNAIDSIDIQLGHSYGARGKGSPNTWPDLPRDSLNMERFKQITWLRTLGGGNELKLQFYHIYHDELNSLGWISDNTTNTRSEFELQHTVYIRPDNRLVWGGSRRKDWVNAPNRFLAEQTIHEHTLFAHDEWRITQQWLLNVGAMLENNGMGGQSTSPRAALNYHLSEKQTLRAGISRAYRNPSVYEERGNCHFILPGIGLAVLYQSSGGLRPEKTLSREIGYLGEFPEAGLSADVRLYHDQLNDIIYETQASPKDFINMFDAKHSGLEVTTRHRWGNNNQLIFNYAYQVISSNYVPYGTNGNYSDTMPRNMISALYSRDFPNDIALSFGYYQQGTMQPIDRPADDRQQFTRRIDAKIAKKLRMDNHRAEGEVALVVQNPLTDRYIDYQVCNQFTRRVFLTMSLSY